MYENPVLLAEVRLYFDKMAGAIEQEVNRLDRAHIHEYNEFGEASWLHVQRLDWHFFVGARNVIDRALKQWKARRETVVKQVATAAQAITARTPATVVPPQGPISMAMPQVPQTPVTPFSAATPTFARTVGIASIVANELGQCIQEQSVGGINAQNALGQCAEKQGGAEINGVASASRASVPQVLTPVYPRQDDAPAPGSSRNTQPL